MEPVAAQPRLLDAGDREAGVICTGCGIEIAWGELVAQCGRCGTVSHRGCWDLRGGCDAYACAPARRDTLDLVAADAWRITPDELASAIPLPVPSPAFQPGPNLPAGSKRRPMSPERRSRMALAALIVALVGIPLFGLVTGIVAIILACVALGSVQRSSSRGLGMAVCGLLIGIIDVIGWSVFLVNWYAPALSSRMRPPEMDLEPAALQAVDQPIADAMRANVVISSSEGVGGERIGAGVILKIEDGTARIVTNRHVIDASYQGGADAGPGDGAHAVGKPVTVRMIGQPATEGTVSWVAPGGADLAMVTVRCTGTEAKEAKYPAPRPPKLGDPAFAVGNPHALGWSLSPGTVSQIRRWSPHGQDLLVIQTTAPINSGNSGGGLYDKEGHVIGINTWTEDKRVSEGIGFAISFESLAKLAPPDSLRRSVAAASRPTTTSDGRGSK